MRGMSSSVLAFLGVAIALACAAPASVPAVSAERFGNPLVYGLRPRLTSLTDLNPLLNAGTLSMAQRTEVLVAWLAQERRCPSPVNLGLGGDIDSGYIQAQIIKALAEIGDPAVLSDMALDYSLDPPPWRSDQFGAGSDV